MAFNWNGVWSSIVSSVKSVITLTPADPYANYLKVVTPQSEIERRKKIVAGLQLSSVPEVAAIQKQAQEEFVLTGKWNPKYTTQADNYRDTVAGFTLPKGMGPFVVFGGLALLALIFRKR